MNFDYTPKVQELREKLAAFMNQHVYPREHEWHEHVKSEKRWEPVPAQVAARAGRRPVEPRLRAAVRDHGARVLVARGVQLLLSLIHI